ncbi:DUF6578 domain-containing protein [Streptomyces sp. NPDC002520]
MALMRVFYEDWQMECCGRPFSVGDEVGWPLVAAGGQDVRDGLRYGAEAWVENHGDCEHPAAGRVRAIDLVRQDYTATHVPEPVEPVPGKVTFASTGRGLEPVPGTRTMESVDRCPRWFGEESVPSRGPRRFRRTVGALVTLEVPDGPQTSGGAPRQPGDQS